MQPFSRWHWLTGYVQNSPDLATPPKIELSEFRDPGLRDFSELGVLLFSCAKTITCSQNSGRINQVSSTPQGELNWTGPTAKGSERGTDQNLDQDLI